MRRGWLQVLIAAWLAAGAAPASATIIVDHPPHPFGGPASDTLFLLFPGFTYSQRLADDFVLFSAEQVVSLNWWGFYDADNPPATETMRVRFYGARSDGLPDEGQLVSETTIQNPSRTATGRIIVTGHGPREFRYEAALASPASLDANTKYWLEIVQIGDTSTAFRWEDSGLSDNGEFAVINPGLADWELIDNQGDLAFQLYVPEPNSLIVLALGLFCSLHRRRVVRAHPKIAIRRRFRIAIIS